MPKVSKKQPHDCQVKVWFTEAQEEELRQRCEQQDIPISVLSRQFILEGLRYSNVQQDSQQPVVIEGARRAVS